MAPALLKPSCILARQLRVRMNVLLKVLPHRLPVYLRNAILAQLFAATADAFACPSPAFRHLAYNERLLAYARFTREQAEKAFEPGHDIETIKTRLYQNAYPLGGRLRKWLGIHTMEEVMAFGQILYRATGVEMQGDAHGEMLVKRCYFSNFYSGRVCGLISALDDGVFAGLSGGSRLAFSQRLTEGGEFCRARLQAVNGAGR
jgi:hypothetical protein